LFRSVCKLVDTLGAVSVAVRGSVYYLTINISSKLRHWCWRCCDCCATNVHLWTDILYMSYIIMDIPLWDM